MEESPNENLYFQILNLDLSPNGSATALADPSTSKQGFDMVYGEDNYIYYAYSEDYDISVKKISNTGSVLWTTSAVDNGADDIVKAIYPSPVSGCVIIYESQSFIGGSHIYAVEVNESGSVQSSVPLSDLSGDQYYESSSITNNGIFVSFKDNTSGNYDIYGQHVLFTDDLNLGQSGASIASGTGDQKSSSVAYDPNEDEALVCYESPDGEETDIHCNDINLSTSEVGPQIIISEHIYNQNNPYVYWSGHSFMISWEDSRLTSSSSPEQDIFFQEIKNGGLILPSGGAPVSLFDQKQEQPIISQYSSDGSFVIIWEDYRSTGKEFCANLYGQSYTSISCSSLGDLNGDGGWNVLDVVTLANCVLAGDCVELINACAGDMNGDGGYNVLDIVSLANCVLAGDCGGRINDASESTIIKKDNKVSIVANGFIGGVEMILSHSSDFTIEMTDRALFADYLTTGNETKLLVISPETENLFIYEGEFEILEVIVANSHAEVSVDLPLVNRFSLSEAYPNPFNPTTTMTLTMPVSGEITVEVYNVLGQVVSTLASGYMDASTYTLTWDASNASSGVYFVQADAEGFTKTQKLMLVK